MRTINDFIVGVVVAVLGVFGLSWATNPALSQLSLDSSMFAFGLVAGIVVGRATAFSVRTSPSNGRKRQKYGRKRRRV